MAVEIAVKDYFPLSVHVSDELLCVEDGWVEEPVWFLPLPIQIAAK